MYVLIIFQLVRPRVDLDSRQTAYQLPVIIMGVARITGLVANTEYTVSIEAGNSVGYGLASDLVRFATAAPQLPSDPFDLLPLSSTASQVSFSWTTPLDLGGAPVLYYVVEHKRLPNGTPKRVPVGPWTNATITGLDGLTRYELRVAAVNVVSQGNLSVIPLTMATKKIVQPTQPANMWVRPGDLTPSSLIIQWSPPIDAGGSSISSYQVDMLTSEVESNLCRIGDPILGYSASFKEAMLPGAPFENSVRRTARVEWRPILQGVSSGQMYRGLSPGTLYMFRVLAQSEVRCYMSDCLPECRLPSLSNPNFWAHLGWTL